VISHNDISVTFDGIVTIWIMRLERRKSKVLEQSDVIQHGYHMVI